MPRLSERQRLLRDVTNILAVAILEEEDNELLGIVGDDERDSEAELLFSQVDNLSELLLLIQSRRYMSNRERIPSSTQFNGDIFWKSYSPSRFRQRTRMNRLSFDRIVSEIKDNPVFHNNSRCPQGPVWIQLAVALDQFGNYGTGASLGRSQELWGIGKGTVDDFTFRVVEALKGLSAKYVQWPTATERRKISRRMSSSGFRGCVGFIDGTSIPLSQKPSVDGECFFDRKQRYSLNAQVVCDDRRRIISFFSGWPGSCADSTIYQEMSLSKDSCKHRYFTNGEYLLADSAYPADLTHNTIVPSYKSNVRGANIEDFNTCVAHVRVVNEHTIGVLKNRWGSLKELRTQLNKEDSMEKILDWIRVCVTLHNMLIDINDVWSDDEPSSSEDEDDTMPNEHNLEEDDDPFLFRRQIKRRAIHVGRKPGGILWFRHQQTDM